MQGLRVLLNPLFTGHTKHALNKLKSLKGRVALLFVVVTPGGSWCARSLAKCVRDRAHAGSPADCVPSFNS